MRGFSFRVAATALCISVAQPAISQTLGDFFNALAQEAQRTERAKTYRAAEQRIRWLVISSRADPSEAVMIAQSFARTLGPTIVAQSQNGRYAVVAGFLDVAKAKENAAALKAIRLVPADSFLTTGQNFRSIVWDSNSGGTTVPLVHNDQLRRSVARIQAALKQLGFYTGAIDGAVGPATSAAFSTYLAQFGPVSVEALDESAISSIERSAADGFKSERDRSLAQQQGFPDSATFENAQSGGFDNYSDYAQAVSAGFKTKAEFSTFKSSGFLDKTQFDAATKQGFSTKQAFDTHQTKLREDFTRAANDLLSDAEAFLRLNPTTAGIVDLASKASALREAVSDGDPAEIDLKAKGFREALNRISGFSTFEAARAAERDRNEKSAVAELVADLQAKKSAIQLWMAQNLMHKATADLADELIAIDAALNTGDRKTLSVSQQNLSALLDRWDLRSEVAKLVQSKGLGIPPAAEPEIVIDRTPVNQFLLDGEGDELVALYNASPTAPSLIKNLVGNFLFETRVASLCAYPPVFKPAAKRAIVSELKPFEADRVNISAAGCAVEDLAKQDIILLKRRDFLKGEPSFVLAVMAKLADGDLRKFDGFSYDRIKAKELAETNMRAAIARDVEAGSRNGYGAILLDVGDDNTCAVVDGSSAVHKPMLETIGQFVESEGRAKPSMIVADAEASYRSLQRHECSSLYASQPDLKKFAAALTADGRKFEFLPVWFDGQAVSAAQQEKQKLEKRQKEAEEAQRLAAAEERRLAAETEARKKSDTAAREAELQQKYGAEARALQDLIAQGIGLGVLGKDPTVNGEAARKFAAAVSSLYPKFAKWNAGLADDYWTPTALSTEVVDYGIAQWKGRALPAIALKAKIDLISAERGERRRQCFLFAVVSDNEFDVYRDGLEIDCKGPVEEELERWMTGHQMESRWRVTP